MCCSNLVHCNVGTARCKTSQKSDWVLKTATFLFRFSSVHLQGVKIVMQNNIFIRLLFLFLITVSQNIFATTTKVTEVHLVVHIVRLNVSQYLFLYSKVVSSVHWRFSLLLCKKSCCVSLLCCLCSFPNTLDYPN